MIETAEEFKRWFDAPPSIERMRKFHEPAAAAVLREIVTRYPECRADVAWRRDAPVDLLADLRLDDDERVRWHVRSNERWLSEHPEDAEPWRDDPDAPINFRLTDPERALLRAGLGEWGGPARCTEELAIAMGFRGITDLFEQGQEMGARIAAGRSMSRTDWTRALLATEIAFMSSVVGSGWDWETTTGYSDHDTLEMLRQLQRKIVTGGVVGQVFGTRPSRNLQ